MGPICLPAQFPNISVTKLMNMGAGVGTGKGVREMRFRWPRVTSVIVSLSPPTITRSWFALPSVSCSYQGPHQGMPLPIVCPPIKEPSSDKEDKQFQFLAGLIKGLSVNPMANFK
ncbi:hypothetical protein GOODEAATRI_033378 [Goodea atripinnis]|uniref:Uncharacterized protein n=1 Tax=Goodea atripinnis TaxID=208336 RepID=A0ABV0NQ85_9TELE